MSAGASWWHPTCSAAAASAGGSMVGARYRGSSRATPSGSTARALMSRALQPGRLLMPATHLQHNRQHQSAAATAAKGISKSLVSSRHMLCCRTMTHRPYDLLTKAKQNR